jgi:hypothetical protein
MIDKIDTILSCIDILLCLIDMGLIVYLFFYRFPPEKKKKNPFKKFGRKFIAVKAATKKRG